MFSSWTAYVLKLLQVAVGNAWECATALSGKAADAQLTNLLHLHDTSNDCIWLTEITWRNPRTIFLKAYAPEAAMTARILVAF